MILDTVTKNAILKALDKTHSGRIRVLQAGEPPLEFGIGHMVATLTVKDPALFRKVLLRGDLAFAEAVMDNTLEVDHMVDFVEWACRNGHHLDQVLHGSFLGTLIPKALSLLRANTIEGAKKNIMAHYDLGNSFYQSWLDPSMSYSSAIFQEHNFSSDLTEAQMRKYDRIIDLLEIKTSDRILEIGCGWGGFFSRAIERKRCHVTAVMNSPAQFSYNQQLVKEQGIEEFVDLRLEDYRKISGQYDKVVSIEMIEAVGEKYWPSYFGQIATALKPHGKALIQAITIRDEYFQTYRSTPDFINSYVFPGGMLLAPEKIRQQSAQQGLSVQDVFEFGASYAETLRRWHRQFLQAQVDGVMSEFDPRFIRMWELYFDYCEGAFRAGRINVGQYLLKKSLTH